MSKAVAKKAVPLPTPLPESETAAILQTIERAARDPTVDIVKMKELFAMRREMETEQAVRGYNAAMAAVQAELVPVVANAYNDHTKSKYAKLDAIAEAVGPIIHKHGFGTSFGTFKSEIPDHQGIVIDVMHAGGHSKTFNYDVPTDATGAKGTVNKTKTHAYGSTLSYGRRYAKLMAFDIAVTTADDDGNAAGGAEFINEEQQGAIRAKIDEYGADVEKFCAFMNVDGIAKIPSNKYEAALVVLDAKRRASK